MNLQNQQNRSKLQNISTTLNKWQEELSEYKTWAAQDGILDDQELAAIKKREENIQDIQQHIQQLLQTEQSTEQSPEDSRPPWEKALAMAMLPVELKLKLQSILVSSSLNKQQAISLINDTAQYYEVNVRIEEDERIKEAAKAALVVSLDQQKDAWTSKAAHELFKKYYYDHVKFEPITLSAPTQQVSTRNLDKIAQNVTSTAPTIYVPITTKNLATVGFTKNLNFNAGIKIVLKQPPTFEEKTKWETEAKGWAFESGLSLFNSSMSALGKNSSSLADVDVIKAAFLPFSAKVRISGPKVQNDMESIDMSLLTIAVSGELSGSALFKDGIPDFIQNISVSFNLSFSWVMNIDVQGKKALDKQKKILKKRNSLIKEQGEAFQERNKIAEQLKKIQAEDQPNPKEIAKLEKQLQKSSKKLQKLSKLINKADDLAQNISKKFKAKGTQLASKLLLRVGAKGAARIAGAFIPGVNVALLVWDVAEISYSIYQWYNAKDPAEIMLEAIKKMPERNQIFLYAIIDKYNKIPNCGDDIDELSNFLEGLSQEAFDRMIERLQDAEIRFGDKASGGISNQFFDQLQKLSEPKFEMSEEEMIQDMMQDSPSIHVKNKGSYLRMPSEFEIGQDVPATLLADFYNDQGQFVTSLSLSNINMSYKVLAQKGSIIEVQLNTSSDGKFWFKVADKEDLYIRPEGPRYWHIIEKRWVNSALYVDPQD